MALHYVEVHFDHVAGQIQLGVMVAGDVEHAVEFAR